MCYSHTIYRCGHFKRGKHVRACQCGFHSHREIRSSKFCKQWFCNNKPHYSEGAGEAPIDIFASSTRYNYFNAGHHNRLHGIHSHRPRTHRERAIRFSALQIPRTHGRTWLDMPMDGDGPLHSGLWDAEFDDPDGTMQRDLDLINQIYRNRLDNLTTRLQQTGNAIDRAMDADYHLMAQTISNVRRSGHAHVATAPRAGGSASAQVGGSRSRYLMPSAERLAAEASRVNIPLPFSRPEVPLDGAAQDGSAPESSAAAQARGNQQADEMHDAVF
ncbi:hypothetical protein TWF696_006864 [Orbilia brochopaga]|uniref:Uncharacterized protein n=1 Tax=Orbilia brochopaga TaxID=3140254 RepID=A0AAV9URL6_9PEZI